MSILESMASWVRARKAFLLLLFSAVRLSSLSMGLVDSTSQIPWRLIFRASRRGERRNGDMLLAGSAVSQAVRTVGGRRGGDTPSLFGLISKFLGAVS